MTPFTKALLAGMLASALAACSSSDNDSSSPSPIDDPTGSDDGSGTTGGGSDDDSGTTGGGSGTGIGIDTVTTERPGTAIDPTGVEVELTTAEVNDCDARELGIYVRTLSEACSVEYGAGRTDASRTDEAPSAPTGLTALLVAEDWIEIDWIPSIDDGEIVAYEIWRDGNLVRTLDEEPDEVNPIHEQRDFLTTTYIDCNYTKNASCFRESDSFGPIGQSFGPVGQPSGSPTYTVVAIDEDGNRSDFSDPATFTLNTIDPNGSPPDLVAEGYELVFEDEFTGDRLDLDKWVTNLSFEQFDANGRAVNGAEQYYVDILGGDFGFAYDPFVFTGDTLEITAAPTPEALLDDARGQPYLSGAISTRSKVDGFRYGYVEVSAKPPSGSGVLSTFFLFQPIGNQYEIDILEYLGREPDGATQNYHYRDGFRFASNGIVVDGVEFDTGNTGVAHASPTMFLDTGVDLSDDFRTYSVLWEPGLIIYYIDGREVRRLSGPRVADVPMDIVAQLTVGIPFFTGDPDSSAFPAKYAIDYIRVYQKP